MRPGSMFHGPARRRQVVSWALLSVLCACKRGPTDSPADQAIDATPPSVLVLGTIHEPDTLDPVFTEVAGAQEIVRVLFGDLTNYDERWQVQPALATAVPAVETTTSGARVRWNLREDLKWSDGAPLTSADVLFGYRIESNPALESTALSFVAQVRGMRALGPHAVEVDWKQVGVDRVSPRVHAILPRHAYPDVATAPKPFRGFGRAPISSGPYRLLQWKAGQHLTLERNPHWVGPQPTIDRLTWRFFSSERQFVAELATGGIDALGESSGLTLDTAVEIARSLSDSHTVALTTSGVWLHLDARLDHPITGRLPVRQAIDRAIDRSALALLAYGGDATPAAGCFPPQHAAFAGGAATELDLAAARAALATAKLPAGAAISLQLASGSRASERAAAYIQSQLAKIGLQVTLDAVPLRVLFAKMRAGAHAPLALYAWRSAPDWDGRSVLHSAGAQNFTKVADQEIDALYGQVERASDRATWARHLAAVDRRYRALLPSIPLLFRRSVSVRPKRLEGWRPTGTTTPVTWNAAQWRLR